MFNVKVMDDLTKCMYDELSPTIRTSLSGSATIEDTIMSRHELYPILTDLKDEEQVHWPPHAFACTVSDGRLYHVLVEPKSDVLPNDEYIEGLSINLTDIVLQRSSVDSIMELTDYEYDKIKESYHLRDRIRKAKKNGGFLPPVHSREVTNPERVYHYEMVMNNDTYRFYSTADITKIREHLKSWKHTVLDDKTKGFIAVVNAEVQSIEQIFDGFNMDLKLRI